MIAFFDTSILLYRFDLTHTRKHREARVLWRQMAAAGSAAISSLVLLEFVQIARTRLQPVMSIEQLNIAVDSLAPMVRSGLAKGTALAAINLSARHALPIKQAAIVQTAIDCGASVLYTERLPNAQRYGGVRIVNPFAPRSWSTRQTLATYTVHAATT